MARTRRRPTRVVERIEKGGFAVATSKKTTKKTTASKRAPAKSSGKSITISIDLDALDKLYKKRYVVVLDGGDTKGGKVSIRDGDTKRGLVIRDGGDTKGAPSRKKPSPRSPAKKAPSKKS